MTASFAVSRLDSGGVEKVEFYHIEVPFVENSVEKRFDIRPDFFFFEVERIESAPRDTARDRSSLLVSYEPIGVILYHVCAKLRGKRRIPKSRLVAVQVDFVNDGRKTVGEFLQIQIPVAHFRFVSVVDLEDICGVSDVRKSFEVAQDYIFVYVLIVVIPRGVACKVVHSARAFLRIFGKVRVENLVVRSVNVHKVEQLVFILNRQAFNVLLYGKYVLFHIRIENRIAGALVERADKFHFVVLAEVCIRKAVIQILSVLRECIIARRTRKFPYERQF